ncbi:DEKNAAC102064 [Brettanomyces naardenensis]|uniref:Actin cytoskeleton-regulatory complex protein SLA1 n=1 Tax=Brettanomyces naardenensis TaxID=13370 RepID=A0A448YJL2_BRENA|nr:DEKNAAC102064 [Brettanomyces naardenensis]
MSSFLGIYVALYDYEAQNEEELNLQQDDLLYVLEKSDVDEWWKVKKRVVDADVEEPVGLVPSTYIEPAKVKSRATALFDYDKQTDEELTFTEGAKFDVYDASDSNWTLVGFEGEFGFVPANYIEIGSGGASAGNETGANSALPSIPAGAAAAAAPYGSSSALNMFPPPPQRVSASPEAEEAPKMPARPQPTVAVSPVSVPSVSEEEEEEAPPMPVRPRSNSETVNESRVEDVQENSRVPPRTGSSTLNSNPDDFYKDDFFTWQVYEIDGKRKRKATLEIGDSQIFITPEGSTKARDWTIRDVINYNSEKKHVFLDFKNPAASYELHAGTKDSADAIVSILADLKGLTSMSALKDIQEASKPSNRPQGKILYDFEAASPDELTCYEGDLVYIVNDKKSKEWWMVENVGTGKKGVVPSNYIKVVGGKDGSSWKNFFRKSSSQLSLSPKKGSKPKNKKRSADELARQRAKEELAREREELERQRRRQERKERELRSFDERERIRRADEKDRERRMKRQVAGSERDLAKPNPHRVRTWIDRSGSFKVEAEFLGVQDGKVHLHKTNGVKIAVAAQKLSVEDLEYVERLTGASLDNYKVAPPKKAKASKKQEEHKQPPENESQSSVPFNDQTYEFWFNFFLDCGADANICERYARTFAREQMDETVLEDIRPALLRSLGLREGDVLKVMKTLDKRFGRAEKETNGRAQADGNGGLFSGTDGALKNNTESAAVAAAPATGSGKFEDDAWAIKPAAKSNEPDKKIEPQFTGSIQDLVDIKPMEPTKTNSEAISSSSIPLPVKPVTPTSTSGLMPFQPTGPLMPMPTGFVPISMIPMLTGQATGLPFQPTTTFGTSLLTGSITGSGFVGSAVPNTTFGQQRTGGASMVMPLSTGAAPAMPTTTFGAPTGGLIQLQPTGVTIQKTGLIQQQQQQQPSFLPMQPTMRTGGLMPTQFSQPIQPIQSQFTQQQFAQPLQQQVPQMAAQPQLTQPQFAQPQFTQPQFAQPQYTQPQFTQPQVPQPAQMPNTTFGVNQLTGMMANTSLNQPLMSQPTGLGFGNGPELTVQPTGHRANLASATPDNPFGF